MATSSGAESKSSKVSAWGQASRLAQQTPASRNRAVDFLRAISIFVVVVGHWMMSSPWADADGNHMGHILTWASWTHWLTWGLQVMPIFFFVGGYSNGITWDANRRDGGTYADWLHARLRRLLQPVLVLVGFWIVVGSASSFAGVPAIYLEVGSQVALVPVWFLAVYSMMVLLAPPMRWLWHRFGLWSLGIPVGLAVAGDVLYFGFGWTGWGWVNYLTLWLAVHQLGFVWLDRRIHGRLLPWTCLLGGLAALYMLTTFGPWPRSLVGVPGELVSNTTPPHLPLLALAATQFGLVLLVEAPLQRWLAKGAVWTATVLISGMIMTVFLWHSSVMMLSYGLGFLLDGFGLHTTPGAPGWWWVHWVWILWFLLVLTPFVALFSRFERPRKSAAPAPQAARQVIGAILMAAALGQLALHGLDAENFLGIRWQIALLPFLGAWLLGMWPRRAPSTS